MNGALLVRKPDGISSFAVIESLQKLWMDRYQVKKREVPKLGHGGTLDPFATGLLIVCVGTGVKLARYFLGSGKCYEGVIKFGETTIPGDPTDPISETSSIIPETREEIQAWATKLTLQPYLQIPPMHSAKKKNGKPLYELAREGIEIEREPKLCNLYSFEILSYEKPCAQFRVICSSGTYVRKLAQDLGRMAGSVALLDRLNRTASGTFDLQRAWTLSEIDEAMRTGRSWDQFECWIPFDRLLDGHRQVEATPEEAIALEQGQQNILLQIFRRGITDPPDQKIPVSDEYQEAVTIYCANQLIAVARCIQGQWSLERVFPKS